MSDKKTEGLFKMAKSHFRSGAYLKAITLLTQCIESSGDSFDEDVVLLRGKCYLKLNQLDNAYDDLTKIPEGPETLNYLGHLYFKKKSFGEAIHYYEKAKKHRERKNDYMLRVNLAICYQKTNQYKKSQKQFNGALHVKENYFPALKGRFETMILNEEFDKAKRDFKKMIKKKNKKLLDAGTKFIFSHLEEVHEELKSKSSSIPENQIVPPPPASTEKNKKQYEIDAMKRELEQRYRQKQEKLQRQRIQLEEELEKKTEDFQRQKSVWSSFQSRYEEHQKELLELKKKTNLKEEAFEKEKLDLEQEVRKVRKRNQQYVRLNNKNEEEIRNLSKKLVETETKLLEGQGNEEEEEMIDKKIKKKKKLTLAIPMKIRGKDKGGQVKLDDYDDDEESAPVSIKVPKKKRKRMEMGLMDEDALLSMLDLPARPKKKQKIDNEYKKSPTIDLTPQPYDEDYHSQSGFMDEDQLMRSRIPKKGRLQTKSASMHPKKQKHLQYLEESRDMML